MNISKEKTMNLYEIMVKIRKFEERVAKYYAEGKINGFVHLYIGEEAVAAGTCLNLKKDDYITSTHRGHGHLIAKGGDVKLMMAELFSKKTGYCKGKGGSMHICDLSLGIMGSNGIVGAGFPIAVGLGYAAKVKGNSQVCVCFFGDGASNRGTFHESINLASVWDLPIVYICENNQYGISGCTRDTMNISDISVRSKSYNIQGYTIPGNDPIIVMETVASAIDNARKGNGTSIVECKTWRHRGHWEGDLDLYRSKEEHNGWLKKDPIINFEQKILNEKIASKQELCDIESKIMLELDEAVEFAKNSPLPNPEDLYSDVFA